MRCSSVTVISEFLFSESFNSVSKYIIKHNLWHYGKNRQDGEVLANHIFFPIPAWLCASFRTVRPHTTVSRKLVTFTWEKVLSPVCGADHYIDHPGHISEFLGVFHCEFLIYLQIHLDESESPRLGLTLLISRMLKSLKKVFLKDKKASLFLTKLYKQNRK